MRISQFLIRFLILIFIPNSFLMAAKPLNTYLTQGALDDQITQLREHCERVYYQIIEKDLDQPEDKKLFPLNYNNNMIIHSDLMPMVTEEASVVLRLIEWLEVSSDSDAQLLLKKLNKLYYLEFHHLISALDFKNTDAPKALQALHDLYECKIGANDSTQTPFRSLLTKCFLTINIVNGSTYGYDSRKEMLTYVLDKVKREMLRLNKQLGAHSIDPKAINQFILLMGVLSVKEPLVKPKIARKLMIGTVVVAGIGFVIWRYVLPNRKYISDEIKRGAEVIRDSFVTTIIDGFIDTARDNIKRHKDLEEISEQVDKKLEHVLEQVDKKLEDTVDKLGDRNFVTQMLIGRSPTKKLDKK